LVSELEISEADFDIAVGDLAGRDRIVCYVVEERMLTAVSTVLGMIPIAPTVFWGPMAFAIMGGLLVATVLTLIFLPTL
jgi:hypothetical protein